MIVGMEAGADVQAVREALRGDASARDRLFEQVYARLLRYHRKLAGGDLALAEELAQETMVRVLRSFAQLREPDRFIPWVLRIATNAWRDHRRRKAEGGRSNMALKTVLKRRMLLNPAANATSVTGRSLSISSAFASDTRCALATWTGEAPTWSTNSRRRCRDPRPTCRARSSSVRSSASPPSAM